MHRYLFQNASCIEFFSHRQPGQGFDTGAGVACCGALCAMMVLGCTHAACLQTHHEGAPVGSWKIRRSLPRLAGGATSFKLVVSWPCWRHWCRWFDCALVHILTLWAVEADQKYYAVKAILKQPFLPLGGTGCSRMFKVHVSQTVEARPGH